MEHLNLQLEKSQMASKDYASDDDQSALLGIVEGAIQPTTLAQHVIPLIQEDKPWEKPLGLVASM